MNVTFSPPQFGNRYVPIKITGLGAFDLDDKGVKIKAKKVAVGSRGLFTLLGLLAGGLVLAVCFSIFHLDTEIAAIIAVSVSGAIIGPAMVKPAKEGEEIEVLFPWSKIKKIDYDRQVGCAILVVQKMKPKGGLFIATEEGSDFHTMLVAQHKKHSAET